MAYGDRRRATDPEEDDYTEHRSGPFDGREVPMMAIAWGNKSVKFRGAIVVTIVVIFCVVASIITTIVYIGGRVERATKEATDAATVAIQANTLAMKEIAKSSASEHRALIAASDRQACINSFEIKDRRDIVANERALRSACWWLDPPNGYQW